jgi:sodium/proline symporter
MAIKSSSDVPSSRRLAVSWSFITLICSLCIGWVGIGFLPAYEGDSEKIFIELIYALTHPVIAGLLLASILAAIMSTADSQLLVASSALSNDVYKTIFQDASPSTLMWVGRFAVVVVALIAWFLALDPESSVLSLVSYAWAGFGAAFGPVLLLSLFWSRLSALGVLTGMVVGAVTVILWKNMSGGVFELYEIIPGFVFSLIGSIVVSYIKPSSMSESHGELTAE